MSGAQITTTIGSNQFFVTLASQFLNPSSESVIERHNHIAYEFIYILEGCCMLATDEDSNTLNQGQYSVTGPGIYHSQAAGGPVKKMSFTIEHTKKQRCEEYYPCEEDELIFKALKSLKLFIGSDDDGAILGLLHDLKNELQSKRTGYYAAMQSLLCELIITLLRKFSGDTDQSYDTPKRTLTDTRSIQIEQFFDFNYNKKVSITDLSKQLYISNRQTVRILREKYNMSFKQKIIEKRIENSKALLSSTDIPVKDIAEHIGYETANFSAMFRQKTGLTPKEYRCQNSSDKLSQLN